MPSQPRDMRELTASVSNAYRQNRVLSTLASFKIDELPAGSRAPMQHAMTVIVATQSGVSIANLGDAPEIVAQTDAYLMTHDHQDTFARMSNIIIYQARRTR